MKFEVRPDGNGGNGIFVVSDSPPTDAAPLMWVVSGHLREICNGNTMNIYAAPEQDRFADFPLYGKAEIDAAVAAERERCAKICEGTYTEGAWGAVCAEAIRARSNNINEQRRKASDSI